MTSGLMMSFADSRWDLIAGGTMICLRGGDMQMASCNAVLKRADTANDVIVNQLTLVLAGLKLDCLLEATRRWPSPTHCSSMLTRLPCM